MFAVRARGCGHAEHERMRCGLVVAASDEHIGIVADGSVTFVHYQERDFFEAVASGNQVVFDDLRRRDYEPCRIPGGNPFRRRGRAGKHDDVSFFEQEIFGKIAEMLFDQRFGRGKHQNFTSVNAGSRNQQGNGGFAHAGRKND